MTGRYGKNQHHAFPHYHPAAVFSYIAAAIVCAMLTMQPVYVIISFAAGTAYALYLGGARGYALGLRPLLAMFALIAVINPLTNHRGATTLFALGDYPITLQALLYGLCAGGMLICVFVWFMCYQRLITNDKFMYLFGRAAPTSSMVISMILKFVPVMTVRMREIADAQAALGLGAGGGGRKKSGSKLGVKNGVRVSGILISRSMEDSIETADSMRARGYGAGPRTSFSRYRIAPRDIAFIAAVALLFAANVWCIFFYGEVSGGGSFRFFPFISGISANPLPYALYAAMLLLPLIDEAVQRLK
ncbi:MAG: energy-coupling factor transporter transmembrane protein EcfT [Clostridiales Family XIII bacterium]|nr:energy-coupling factor transporter transmembrane protein EcfT [Clostridiales Family XIII bacterium]